MADVLSQSQIDALLKSMSADAPAQETKTESVQPLSPEEKNYIKYDFFSPRKFTKEKMKILRSVFENYARILTSQINGIFRVMTDITVLDVQERKNECSTDAVCNSGYGDHTDQPYAGGRRCCSSRE